MTQSRPCAYCNETATTSIPVADSHGRVCTRHAEHFWRAVVRTGAALAHLEQATDDALYDDAKTKEVA